MLTPTVSELAALAATAALVWAVIGERAAGRTPLVSLGTRWFGRGATTTATIVAGLVAGILLVIVPLGADVARGALAWASAPPPTVGLVVLTVVVKALLVVFEEIIFRGAVLDALRRFGVPQAVIASALLFGAAHAARSTDASHLAVVVVTTIDGVGYGAAAVLTGSLWTPVVWHLAKNLAVWQLTGTSPLQFAPGAFQTAPSWAAAASDAFEAVAAVMIVSAAVAVLAALRRRRL